MLMDIVQTHVRLMEKRLANRDQAQH
jgi:hypothetical protein